MEAFINFMLYSGYILGCVLLNMIIFENDDDTFTKFVKRRKLKFFFDLALMLVWPITLVGAISWTIFIETDAGCRFNLWIEKTIRRTKHFWFRIFRG